MTTPLRTELDKAAALATALGALRHAIQRYWDEHEGGIYNHANGEIRANVLGAGPDGHRFFNL